MTKSILKFDDTKLIGHKPSEEPMDPHVTYIWDMEENTRETLGSWIDRTLYEIREGEGTMTTEEFFLKIKDEMKTLNMTLHSTWFDIEYGNGFGNEKDVVNEEDIIVIHCEEEELSQKLTSIKNAKLNVINVKYIKGK